MTILESPSPNHAPRRSPISAVVLHDTGGKTAAGALAWFAKIESGVSSHYVIDRDGTIYRCVPEALRAWHAGMSQLWGRDDVNDFSVGVELVDENDAEPYPLAQLVAAVDLVADCCARHRIPLNRIVGHQHIATPYGRKSDPGRDFGWEAFLLQVAQAIVARPKETP